MPTSLVNRTQEQLALVASQSNFDIWHRRLGHPNLSFLLKFIRDNHVLCEPSKEINVGMCNACMQGKHVQLPFGESTSK